MLRTQIKQNVDVLLKNMKKLALKSTKMQRLLLNIQIICKMSIKILKSTTQIENVKY